MRSVEEVAALQLPGLAAELSRCAVQVIQGRPGSAELRAGIVRWSSPTRHDTIWVEWCWCEIAPAVFALQDPRAIEAPFRLVDESGVLLADSARVVLLNQLVRRIPWQARVLEHLAAQ